MHHSGEHKLPFWVCIGITGLVCFILLLANYNIADGDLWARLAVGSRFWNLGSVWARDIFAFTPTLPQWIDHEWGAGVLFFLILKIAGPAGLMGLKILLATAALGLPLYAARRGGASTLAGFLMALPVAWTILPGYVPVVRSHALTYVFFALFVLLMELGRHQPRWFWMLPALMLLWANVHGGFVTGFVILACYGLLFWDPERPRGWLVAYGLTVVACVGVTLVNPYGLEYWSYLAGALFHPRPRIVEWSPMPLWGWDAFTGFRVLFLMSVVLVAIGWQRMDATAKKRSFPGLLLIILTAFASWQHRRHAPFFGIAACAILPAYVDAVLAFFRARWPELNQYARWVKLVTALTCLMGAGYAIRGLLPTASLQVLAPVGLFPVRECDVLSRAKLSGNVVVPFDWGSYVAWRLHPKVKVSIDGRYEETFPESTFELNEHFYNKEGAEWQALIHNYKVDFVILDLRRTNLQFLDLERLGFKRVWVTPGLSELWATQEFASLLMIAAELLPPTTIQPLDPAIANAWFRTEGGAP